MKYLKSIITVSAIAFTLSLSAQSNVQTIDETTYKNYQIERNGADSFYTLKIESMRDEVVALEESDRYDLNQDRVNKNTPLWETPVCIYPETLVTFKVLK